MKTMQITWNGLGSFTINAKPVTGDVALVTDPFENSTGLKLPRALAASIVIASHNGPDASNTSAVGGEESKTPFTVTHAGEYEVKGIFVHGIDAPLKDGSDHTIYRITAEGMRIGFLGSIDRTLKDKELEKLGNIDILILPVGGNGVLDKEAANDVVSQVEPRMVIPSHFDTKGLNEKRDDVEGFCKELACVKEEMNKLKITKASLPAEDMKISVLSR